MQAYAFDLLPWPHLAEPSSYPDANALFDPPRGQQVYAEHLEQTALCEDYGFDAIRQMAPMSASLRVTIPLEGDP